MAFYSNPMLEAAVESIELDAFSKDVPNLVQFEKSLYTFFKENATTIPVSYSTAAGGVTRPSFRVPLRIQAGASAVQGTGNADSLGRGSASQYAAFALSPVIFYNPCEFSFLSQKATEGRKRGLFSIEAQELQHTFQTAVQNLEALLQGDGSGTLDIIPTTATVNNGTGGGALGSPTYSSIVGLNNAFQFTDQQTIQVFSAVGGTNRGSFTTSYVDPVTQTIWSAQALPAGTTTGDYLIVSGASGSANGSILGLKAWDVNSNSGTIGGLNRANYPGRLSTPTINLNGNAVSLTTGLRALVLLNSALGQSNPAIRKSTWYVSPYQAFQIANLYFNTMYTNSADVGGKDAPDVAKGFFTNQFAGRPLLVGNNADHTRLELIAPDSWYLCELFPLELYDFGNGTTVMPVPDIANSGSYLSSFMFIYTSGLNLANSNPRAALYVQNAAVPVI